MLDAAATASMWLIPAMVVALLMLAGALFSLHMQRNCPSCHLPMRTLAEPHSEGNGPYYEVMVCDGCCNVATLAHGHKTRFAYCPACMNRSMRTPAMRLRDGEGTVRVRVEEHCELCGHHDERVIEASTPVPAPPRDDDNIIQFPGPRVEPAQRADQA